jgi:hypothetical protein
LNTFPPIVVQDQFSFTLISAIGIGGKEAPS